MRIAKPDMSKIDRLACVAVGVTSQTVLNVWHYASIFNSWDLETFMVSPPTARSTIYKVRRVLFLSKVTGV